MNVEINGRQWSLLQRLACARRARPAILDGGERHSVRALERRGLAEFVPAPRGPDNKPTRPGGWVCSRAGRKLLATRPTIEWLDDAEVIVRGVEHLPENALPGREAEELRAGVERLLEQRFTTKEARTLERQLRELLDQVNARDSLVYLVARDNRKGAST